MIGTKLIGGLGNQMFQYALGKKMSMMHNTKLIIDLTGYVNQSDTDTQRHFELNKFNITGKLQAKPADSKRTLLKIFSNGHIFTNTYKEKQFPFDEKVLDQPNGTLFEGYWQTEKYFIDIRDQLLKDFALKSALSSSDENYLVRIHKTNSVSLHVRRGDYVSNENANKFHGLKGLDYYKQAIKLIAKNIDDFTLYVFSDDIQWCKQNLKNIHNQIVFVDDEREGVMDMLLMKNCKHNIIANSSFSWWAAWLNENAEKMVVAPKSWFNDPSTDTKDVVPSSWVKI